MPVSLNRFESIFARYQVIPDNCKPPSPKPLQQHGFDHASLPVHEQSRKTLSKHAQLIIEALAHHAQHAFSPNHAEGFPQPFFAHGKLIWNELIDFFTSKLGSKDLSLSKIELPRTLDGKSLEMPYFALTTETAVQRSYSFTLHEAIALQFKKISFELNNDGQKSIEEKEKIARDFIKSLIKVLNTELAVWTLLLNGFHPNKILAYFEKIALDFNNDAEILAVLPTVNRESDKKRLEQLYAVLHTWGDDGVFDQELHLHMQQLFDTWTEIQRPEKNADIRNEVVQGTATVFPRAVLHSRLSVIMETLVEGVKLNPSIVGDVFTTHLLQAGFLTTEVAALHFIIREATFAENLSDPKVLEKLRK